MLTIPRRAGYVHHNKKMGLLSMGPDGYQDAIPSYCTISNCNPQYLQI